MWIIPRIIAAKLPLILVVVMVDGAMAVAVANDGRVRVWGDLSSTYRERVSDNEVSSTRWRNTGTVNASSYIWHPWFALISGGVSLTLEERDDTGRDTVEDQFTSGNVQFDLFPTSRFPFQIYYSESRDEFENQALDQTFEKTEYGISQRYRSRDGTGNYRFDYDYEERDRDGQQQFELESLLFSGINNFNQHRLETDISLDSVDNVDTGEEAENNSITLDHSYGSSTHFSLDNLVSSSRIESDFFESSSDIDTSQVASFVSWHPGERRNLRLTGSLRAAETETLERDPDIQPDGELESDSSNVNLSQGLLYRYSENLRFNESVNLSSTETNGETVSLTSFVFGGLYSSDRIESRFGNYGWSAGSNYSTLQGDIEEQSSLRSRFSHSLTDSSLLDNGYRLRTDLTQSLNYDYEFDREDEKRIDHYYSMTWTRAAINRQNEIRFSIRDSREFNGDDDYFHQSNFQYTGTSRRTRYTRFSGNATVQYTKQGAAGNSTDLLLTTGQLQYFHSRLFRTPGLSFASELGLSERRRDDDRLIGSSAEGTTTTWENSLVYLVGRLEARVDLDFIKVGDEYDYILELELKRSFGDL